VFLFWGKKGGIYECHGETSRLDQFCEIHNWFEILRWIGFGILDENPSNLDQSDPIRARFLTIPCITSP
jgi:hypothetical protein